MMQSKAMTTWRSMIRGAVDEAKTVRNISEIVADLNETEGKKGMFGK